MSIELTLPNGTHKTLADRRFNSVEAMAAYCLRRRIDEHIVIGPTVWQPDEDGSRNNYFIVKTKFHATSIGCSEEDANDDNFVRGAEWKHNPIAAAADTVLLITRVTLRMAIIRELKNRGLRVHDERSDLEAARVCERLWPSEAATKIRREIEAERAAHPEIQWS